MTARSGRPVRRARAPVAQRKRAWLGPGIALCMAALAFAAADASADLLADQPGVYEQRLAYQRAVTAVRAGRRGEFRREASRLKDYALHPYLVYYEAQGHVTTMRPKRARELRTEFADTPIADRFYRQWLNAQVRRSRWDVYLEHYEPSSDPAAQCNYLRALYRSGERSAALAQVGSVWVAPESLPKTCDPLFEVWIAAGNPDQDTAWARLALALDAGERSLSRYLLRFFDSANAAAAQLYYDMHGKPRAVRSLRRFANTDGGRRALRHGLIRYARDDPAAAWSVWRRARDDYDFTDAERRYLEERLAVASAADGDVPDGAPSTFSADAQERISDGLVRNRRWKAAARWIAALPEGIRAQPEWRYWLGRAQVASGQGEAGRANLAAAAEARHYYGFLAAHALDVQPALNAEAPKGDRAAMRALLDNSVVRRMAELHAVRDLANARREWRHALRELAEPEQRTLVELTAEIGWTEQAIFGARDAELMDMVALRFPMPFLATYRRFGFDANLTTPFLLAVTRQESAFNPRAVSSAGARGLMQLMPATARHVAGRVRVRLPSPNDLFDPNTNVRLGAHHLAALMNRYDNHRALAAAAYNAGETRVARWRKGASGMPTDVWIERIPFRETRDYVKGVIAFHHIYSRLLGNPAPVLGDHERLIP